MEIELTPEQRKLIYEEEKLRIEAERLNADPQEIPDEIPIGFKFNQRDHMETVRPGLSLLVGKINVEGRIGRVDAFVDSTPRLHVNAVTVRIGRQLAIDFYCMDYGISFTPESSEALAGTDLGLDVMPVLNTPSSSLMMDIENGKVFLEKLAKVLGAEVSYGTK